MKLRTSAKCKGKCVVVEVEKDGTIRLWQERCRMRYTIPADKLYQFLSSRQGRGESGSSAPLDGPRRSPIERGRNGRPGCLHCSPDDLKIDVRHEPVYGTWYWAVWVPGYAEGVVADGHARTKEAAKADAGWALWVVRRDYQFRAAAIAAGQR